jgi:hypothetical protein
MTRMSTTILDRNDPRLGAELAVRAGAAAALFGSAVVHSTVVSEHYGAWPLAGVFFLSLQVVETALALAVIFFWSFTTAAVVCFRRSPVPLTKATPRASARTPTGS